MVLKQGLATKSGRSDSMADGIVSAVNLIKNSKVRNPMLVLINDGIPNIPLWTLDAKADALEAAALIAKEKIRFICIGVEAHRFYLEKLAEKAEGVVYLVDDLNKDNLINIVRMEKQSTGDNKLA